MSKEQQNFLLDHPALNQIIKDATTIISRPLQILFRIPAGILDFLYHGVEYCIAKVPNSLGKLLGLPINLLIEITNRLDSRSIVNKVIEGIKKIHHQAIDCLERHVGSKSPKRRLKLYSKMVSRHSGIKDTFHSDFLTRNIAYSLSLLCMIITSLSTYAGAEIFFAGFADFLPLIVTTVIQSTEFICIINIFRPGSKKKYIIPLVFTFWLSVVSSYVGISTTKAPPQKEYQASFECYSAEYEQQRQEAMDKLEGPTKIIPKIVNNCNTMLKALPVQIAKWNELDEKAKTEKKPISSTYGIETRTSDNVITTKRIFVKNSGYSEEKQEYDAIQNDYKSLNTYLRTNIPILIKWLPDTVDLSNDQDMGKLAEYLSENMGNLDSSKLEDFLKENFYIAVENGEYPESLEKFKEEYIKSTIEFNSVLKISDLQNSLKVANLDELESEIRKKDKLSKMELESPFSEEDYKPETTGSSDVFSAIQILLRKSGDFLGIKIGTEMKDATKSRLEIQDIVDSSYAELTPYLGEPASYGNLAEARKHVMEIPDIMIVAFERFADESSRATAIICMGIALMSDVLSLLLGRIGAKNHSPLLYINSSRDYEFSSLEELFGGVFRAMQTGQIARIASHQYDDMSNEEFEKYCFKYVSGLNQHIWGFLNSFTFSPCTVNGGFGLCYHYRDDAEIKKYLAILTALSKTNLIKVIPFAQYQDLQRKYYMDIDIIEEPVKGIKADSRSTYHLALTHKIEEGAVILMKSKGENFLRENVSDSFILESLEVTI